MLNPPPPSHAAPGDQAPRRSALRDPVFVALCLLCCAYYAATRGIFEGKASGDGLVAFLYLPGVVYHHTLDLAATARPATVASFGREATGLVANPNPIGPPLLWAPFYLVGLLIKKVVLAAVAALGGRAPLLFVTWARNIRPQQSEYDFFMTGLGSLAFGLCGVARLFHLLRRHLGLAAARFGAATAVLASPLSWYLTTQPLYQHACAFFAVTLLVERWDAYRSDAVGLTLRRAATLGLLAGLCLMMRTQEGLWLLLPAVDLLAGLWRALRGPAPLRPALAAIGRGLTFLCCTALCFAPQAALWYHYYGRVRPPQKPGHIRWGDPAWIELLFSMRAGLFPWIPALYLVVPGLCWLMLRRPRERALALALALMFLGQLYVNAAVFDFHCSWAFGPRRFTDCVVVLALGLAGLYAAAGRRGRLALTVCAVALIGWNSLLVELVRLRKIKSSSSGAFPASVWVGWAEGPAWLARAFDRVGFPFTQPAGLIFSLAYHVPPRVFEGVVGNYLLDRDIGFRALVTTRTISFSDPWATYVVEGAPSPAGLKPGALVPVQPRVRVLVPLRAAERLRVLVRGELGARPGDVRLTWNGAPLKAQVQREGLLAEVPQALVHTHARANELVLTGLAPGARLQQLDFESLGDWWR